MGIQTVSQALSNENVAPFGFKNRIINGNFDIWQRGTSFSNPNDTYTADRFLVVAGGGTTGDTVSQQTFTPGQTDVPGEPTYFLRFAVGATSANRVMHHRVEDVRTFAGQTCTLSFYAKASTAHTSSVEFAQNFGSGGSTQVTQSAISYTMSTSWQKFTFTVTLPSIAGKTIGTSSYLYIAFIRSLPASSVNIDIAQMQFEKGPQATAFDVRPYTTELQLCQRYYQRNFNPTYAGIGTAASAVVIPRFSVVMRVAPTVSALTTANIDIFGTGSNLASTTTLDSITTTGFRAYYGGMSGSTFGQPGHLINDALQATAEL
jgi:hypothetical protein